MTSKFTLYPATDIKNGKCVRLLFGDMNKETIYNNDPLNQANWFVDQGAEWLHIVDLDGAVKGDQVNKNSILKILKTLLEGQLTSEISMSNYTTLLEQEKSAFYSGETFSGNIVLGRKDASTRPNRVELKLDGRNLTEGRDFSIEDGRVKLNVSAGRPGDHKIEGSLIFLQDGEETVVPVSSTFATISKPNAAVISADKMNVVYRGVDNPMTISIPGVADNNVNASLQRCKLKPAHDKEV